MNDLPEEADEALLWLYRAARGVVCHGVVMMVPDHTPVGAHGSGDHAVARWLRERDADRRDDAGGGFRRGLPDRFLCGRWCDDEPPTAPR